MVQMGWDGQVRLPGHCRTVWYVQWDPTVPHGTNGMDGQVGLCGTYQGIQQTFEAVV